MIYYIQLQVSVNGNITNVIPKCVRHLLEITDSGYLGQSSWKYRKMTGFLTQRQFDRLVKEASFCAYDDGNPNKRSYVTFRRRLPTLNQEIKAAVKPLPQKFKRSGQPHKTPTVMKFRNNKQLDRLNKAVLKKYA